MIKIAILLSIIGIFILYEWIKDKFNTNKPVMTITKQCDNAIDVYKPVRTSMENISHIERRTETTNKKVVTETIYYENIQ